MTVEGRDSLGITAGGNILGVVFPTALPIELLHLRPTVDTGVGTKTAAVSWRHRAGASGVQGGAQPCCEDCNNVDRNAHDWSSSSGDGNLGVCVRGESAPVLDTLDTPDILELEDGWDARKGDPGPEVPEVAGLRVRTPHPSLGGRKVRWGIMLLFGEAKPVPGNPALSSCRPPRSRAESGLKSCTASLTEFQLLSSRSGRFDGTSSPSSLPSSPREGSSKASLTHFCV